MGKLGMLHHLVLFTATVPKVVVLIRGSANARLQVERVDRSAIGENQTGAAVTMINKNKFFHINACTY
ncbi:MAG: hypothetical protein ACREOZ_02450 [Gloeomargaritales cyanobacterium]